MAIVALVIVVVAKRAARSTDPLQHPADNAALHSVQLSNPGQYAGYGVPQYSVYALQYPPPQLAGYPPPQLAGAGAGKVEPLSR